LNELDQRSKDRVVSLAKQGNLLVLVTVPKQQFKNAQLKIKSYTDFEAPIVVDTSP